jgi:hypothetical protein
MDHAGALSSRLRLKLANASVAKPTFGSPRSRSMVVDYAVLCALCLVSIFAWDRFWNSALFAYCFYLGIMLPKVLSDELAPRLFGNGIGVSVSLALLLP